MSAREDFAAEALDRWEWNGLECLIRDSGIGFYNGYVRLPNHHPMRGKGYSELNRAIAIHGGLTYGPNADGWVGFDTGHSGDYWPGIVSKCKSDMPRTSWATDWDLSRLRAEVQELAEQLALLTSLPDPESPWDCSDDEFTALLEDARKWREHVAAPAEAEEALPPDLIRDSGEVLRWDPACNGYRRWLTSVGRGSWGPLDWSRDEVNEMSGSFVEVPHGTAVLP